MGTNWSKTPKSTRTPREIDVAWAAGFIEGEGCFTALTPANHRGKWKYRAVRISVGQQNTEPLIWLQEFFGGSIHTRKKCAGYSKRPGSIWILCGNRARELAQLVFPFLSKKRKQKAKRLFEVVP